MTVWSASSVPITATSGKEAGVSAGAASAAEKFRQVQEAYEEIKKERRLA